MIEPCPLSAPTQARTDWDLSTLDGIRTHWDEIERQRTEYLEQLTPDALHDVLSYRTLKGDPFSNPLWQLLRHVVNHSTYHRGQVTTMLRQLGAATVSMDMIVFYRERLIPAAGRSA